MSNKKALFITPRLAIQKGDFLGSVDPYWPVEAATFAAMLREKGWEVSVLDLFGSAPERLTSDQAVFWQGLPLEEALKQKNVLTSECDAVFVYALSSMSHQELLAIVRIL